MRAIEQHSPCGGSGSEYLGKQRALASSDVRNQPRLREVVGACHGFRTCVKTVGDEPGEHRGRLRCSRQELEKACPMHVIKGGGASAQAVRKMSPRLPHPPLAPI